MFAENLNSLRSKIMFKIFSLTLVVGILNWIWHDKIRQPYDSVKFWYSHCCIYSYFTKTDFQCNIFISTGVHHNSIALLIRITSFIACNLYIISNNALQNTGYSLYEIPGLGHMGNVFTHFGTQKSWFILELTLYLQGFYWLWATLILKSGMVDLKIELNC
jgi:hypothetical protein